MNGLIKWYKQSEKNYPLYWLIGVLIIGTCIWYFSSTNVSNKLNKESKLTVGAIYKMTKRKVYYRFEVNQKDFEDSYDYSSGFNYYTGKPFDKPNIGDKVLIRYYPKDPYYNIRVSKTGLNLDTLNFGQIIEPADLGQVDANDIN